MVGGFTPRSLAEALRIRAGGPVIPFAGGTDLMVRRRSWAGTLPRFEAPPLFIGGLPELREIRQAGDQVFIGAGVTLAALLEAEAAPELLKRAAVEMASPAIRNQATLGGNLCNASPAGDTLPPLYALGGVAVLESAAGRRELPIGEFIQGPGRTALAPDELLIGVRIPIADFPSLYYRKVGTRRADALSKLSCAGLARIEGGRVAELRMALGAVAPTVIRLVAVEARLTGLTLDAARMALPEALAEAAPGIRPIDDQRSSAAYRSKVALGLIEDFVTGLIP